MGKILHTCEFGVVHSVAQCRCMSSHVTVRYVECSVPDEHMTEPYIPKHRKED